jgi:hypothetical protein
MQQKVSHKSEMAGPFSRSDTIINKTFTFTFFIFEVNNFRNKEVIVKKNCCVKSYIRILDAAADAR